MAQPLAMLVNMATIQLDKVDVKYYNPPLKYGDHVAVTGKWVQDVGHGTAPHDAWNDIHPAAKVEKIPQKRSSL